MKKLLPLIITVISVTTVYSQGINYQKYFIDAQVKADKEHKPIFIMITQPAMMHVPDADFTSGIDTKEAADYYNKKFVSYKISVSDSAASKVRKIFNPSIFPAFVFLDSKAQLVYTDNGNSPLSKKYLDMAQEAFARIASGKTMSHYEELDKKGTITTAQLKEYITLKEGFNRFDNAKLVDEYVNHLEVKAFDDYNEVLFILKAGPIVDGKTYKLCHIDLKVYDSIYKHEPVDVRSAINSNIIRNTINEGTSTKSIALIQAGANYARVTWGNDYQKGNRSYLSYILYYYKTIKDTANYYRQAPFYYDNYYLNISADSAKKLTKIALDKVKQSITDRNKAKSATSSPANNEDKKSYPIVFGEIGRLPTSGDIASTLNTGAYDFYILGTHNITNLTKALIWSRRAIELNPTYSYYDTMAHIMYRMGFYDEAQLNEQKAIDMVAIVPNSTTRMDIYKNELLKMKEHLL